MVGTLLFFPFFKQKELWWEKVKRVLCSPRAICFPTSPWAAFLLWALSWTCFPLGWSPPQASKGMDNRGAPFGIIWLSPLQLLQGGPSLLIPNSLTNTYHLDATQERNWLSPHREDTKTIEAKGKNLKACCWLNFSLCGQWHSKDSKHVLNCKPGGGFTEIKKIWAYCYVSGSLTCSAKSALLCQLRLLNNSEGK